MGQIMNITSSSDIGKLIRQTRLEQSMTQGELAMASGTGIRFISNLENGKESCQLQKVLHIMKMLGIKLTAIVPR